MNGPPSSSTQNKGSLKFAGESRIREYNLNHVFHLKTGGSVKAQRRTLKVSEQFFLNFLTPAAQVLEKVVKTVIILTKDMSSVANI